MNPNTASPSPMSMLQRTLFTLFVLLILFTSTFAVPAQAAGGLSAVPKGILPTHSELDIDGDGVPNAIDNCRAKYNPMHNPYQPLPTYPNPQLDADHDGLGDPCDDDYESQITPPPGYVDLSGGVGVFFADDNGEPLQVPDSNCFTSITLESSGFRPIIINNYCVSISTSSPPYYFYRCSGFCAYDPSAGVTTLISKITFQCAEGGSYPYEIKGGIFEMIALNTRCELIPQHLWTDPTDDDYDDDGVPDAQDKCPYEFGATPDGCPVECKQHAQKWRAYVSTLGLENDLYYYETIVNYCYSDTFAEIKSARFYGDVDSGLDEAGLSVLGFTPTYRSDESASYISSDKTRVEMLGRFDMCFETTVFFDKIGLKKTVEEKALGFLSHKIAKLLTKYGGVSGPQASQKLMEAADELGIRLLETADEAVEGAVPGPVGDYLRGKVNEWLEAKILVWKETIGSALASGSYTDLTAEHIAEDILDALMAELAGLTEVCFETWEPTYNFYVFPGGNIIDIQEDRFTNPFLSVEQVY